MSASLSGWHYTHTHAYIYIYIICICMTMKLLHSQLFAQLSWFHSHFAPDVASRSAAKVRWKRRASSCRLRSSAPSAPPRLAPARGWEVRKGSSKVSWEVDFWLPEIRGEILTIHNNTQYCTPYHSGKIMGVKLNTQILSSWRTWMEMVRRRRSVPLKHVIQQIYKHIIQYVKICKGIQSNSRKVGCWILRPSRHQAPQR